MKKLGLLLILSLLPVMSFASAGKSCGQIECWEFDADLTDQASLQRGAAAFTNYCMGCHSAKYSRFGRLADDMGVPRELFAEAMIDDPTKKVGELMTISMDPVDSKKWFGATPPDLTLVARVRGSQWVYTYLNTFYVDPMRPWGVNNLVFKDVGMPHVLLDLQGKQELLDCKRVPMYDERHRAVIDTNSGGMLTTNMCRDILHKHDAPESHLYELDDFLQITKAGSMSDQEFKNFTYDLVNFLTYNAEPMQLERKRIGLYVLLFLSILFVFVYFLNKEYWKEIH